MLTSWRTTILGLCAAATAWINGIVAMFDADSATNPDFAMILALSLTAWGLLVGRDNRVTSEHAKAK